jgi:hypothetical protein
MASGKIGIAGINSNAMKVSAFSSL